MVLSPQSYDPRQIMRRSDYELQYKRDTYLKDVALHHHDFFEIYFLVSGDVTYTIESRLCRVLPGDLLLISPRELHQVYIRSDISVYERYVLWISPQRIRELSGQSCDLFRVLDPANPNYVNQLRLKPEDQALIRGLMEGLFRESQQDSFGSELLCSSLLVQILVTINRLAVQEGDHHEPISPSSQLISDIIRYIGKHYSEELSLDILAEHFFVSKYHLSHEFNRQVGTSVYRYILKKRLQIAREFLSQGNRPSHVSTLCGFRDYPGFYRAFKAEYGISPRQFSTAAQQK